jgi:hypothetical protein
MRALARERPMLRELKRERARAREIQKKRATFATPASEATSDPSTKAISAPLTLTGIRIGGATREKSEAGRR